MNGADVPKPVLKKVLAHASVVASTRLVAVVASAASARWPIIIAAAFTTGVTGLLGSGAAGLRAGNDHRDIVFSLGAIAFLLLRPAKHEQKSEEEEAAAQQSQGDDEPDPPRDTLGRGPGWSRRNGRGSDGINNPRVRAIILARGELVVTPFGASQASVVR